MLLAQGKYPPDSHGEIPMAEFASKGEASETAEKANAVKRDPQLQEIMDLTIEKLRGGHIGEAPPASAPVPPFNNENHRLIKYKR